jgi:hypothetical protein
MTVNEFFEMELPPERAAAISAAADWLRGQDDPAGSMTAARDRFGLSAMSGCRALELVRRSAGGGDGNASSR